MKNPFRADMEKSSSERITSALFVVIVSLFFLLPITWLFLAPFDGQPTYRLKLSDPSFNNFREMSQNPYAYRSLLNSQYSRLAQV